MLVSTASDVDVYLDDDIELINDLEMPDGIMYEAETATASDAYMCEVVIETCKQIQLFMYGVIIAVVMIALYKFFKIFF